MCGHFFWGKVIAYFCEIVDALSFYSLICMARLYFECVILICSISLGVIIFSVTYCGCDCAIVAVVTVESVC